MAMEIISLLFLPNFTGFNFKGGKKDIKEKIACNTEQNLLQNKELHICNHKENTKATPNLLLAEEGDHIALS